METNLKQPTRLIAMIVYLAVILLVSFVLFGSVLPPVNEKGLWFFSSLIMILLGNLLVTPFYTKPVDAISYSTAAIVSMLSVSSIISRTSLGFEQYLWYSITLYLVICIVLGFLCVALYQTKFRLFRNVSSLSYIWVSQLSSPMIVFTLVLLFALIAFHRHDPREYILISVVWMLISIKPVETLFSLIKRSRQSLHGNKTITKIGEVVGHENPGIIILKQYTNDSYPIGSLVLTRSESGACCLAMVLDYIGFSSGRWVRTIYLQDYSDSRLCDVSDGSSYIVNDIAQISHEKRIQNANGIVGIVVEETRINRILIEILRSDVNLVQGRIVCISINNENVYCQITNATIKDDVLRNKDKRSYIIAAARKRGTWDSVAKHFNTVHWVPLPNERVLLVDEEEEHYDHDAIGNIPSTDFHVYTKTSDLVSHNTAILGILGVGKSCLALELIERMLLDGIKVICLDLTDQYSKELSTYLNPNNETDDSELIAAGSQDKDKCSQNVADGGSVKHFRIELEKQMKEFLKEDNKHSCRIINPAKIEVWKQDGKLYSNKAPMAMLTPCEITRIVTECALKILQESGMTEKAKCCLVYEEAHSLVPEWNSVASEGDKTATSGTAKAVLQGRKYGLGCMLITQRTANVTKTILNQCNTIFAMRVYDATGMEFLKNYIGDDYVGVLSELPDRHAVVFGRGISCREPVMLKLNDREKFKTEARNSKPKVQS